MLSSASSPDSLHSPKGIRRTLHELGIDGTNSSPPRPRRCPHGHRFPFPPAGESANPCPSPLSPRVGSKLLEKRSCNGSCTRQVSSPGSLLPTLEELYSGDAGIGGGGGEGSDALLALSRGRNPSAPRRGGPSDASRLHVLLPAVPSPSAATVTAAGGRHTLQQQAVGAAGAAPLSGLLRRSGTTSGSGGDNSGVLGSAAFPGSPSRDASPLSGGMSPLILARNRTPGSLQDLTGDKR
jgi:hypothetical protein